MRAHAAYLCESADVEHRGVSVTARSLLSSVRSKARASLKLPTREHAGRMPRAAPPRSELINSGETLPVHGDAEEGDDLRPEE